jgi:hypothetical protein
VKAAAKRKGLTMDEYCARIFRAAIQSETAGAQPGFLEAWEKLLAQSVQQKKK